MTQEEIDTFVRQNKKMRDTLEWIWLPVSDSPKCPIEWKKEYLGVSIEY